MYVRGKGVEFATVVSIIEKVSAEKYSGNVERHTDARPCGQNGYGYAGRVWVAKSRGEGARRSWTGRRLRAACWHANRDVMRAIFETYPHATITTAMARYVGAAGFENTYPRTADQNIGSEYQPAYMPDLCDCTDFE